MTDLPTGTYTEIIQRGRESKYGRDVVYKAAADVVKASEQADGSLIVEGWASTRAVDRESDIIEPTAYQSSLSMYLDNPIMFFMHDWYGVPIGKIEGAEIKADGLWVKARVLPTDIGRDIILLIKHRVLKSFSVGFRLLKSIIDETTRIRTIVDLELLEISVVNIPANPFAVFSEAKNLKLELKHLASGENAGLPKQRSNTMADQDAMGVVRELEKTLGKVTPALETANKEIDNLRKNQEEVQKLLKQVQDKNDEFGKNQISRDELNTFTDRIGTDILNLQANIDRALATMKGRENRQVVHKDWRGYIKDYVFLRDENGNPASAIAQKAYMMFQLPVDYDKSTDGHLLKMVRDVYDTIQIQTAYFRRKNGHCDPRRLKSWGYLKQLVDLYDPEFSKSLYSTGTGLGDEWVPTGMSAELFDLLRIQPSLAQLIPQFEMPTNPYEWPILTSGATAYRAAEAASNSPDQLLKSNIGTSKITFTAETLATVVLCSPELQEDSIIEIAGAIREELAFGITDGFEDALVNGDDSATHFDTGRSLTSSSTSLLCAFKGLRKLAVGLSKTFDTQSTSAGVGDAAATFGLKDVSYLNVLAGAAGIDPANWAYVVSPKVRWLLMNLAQVTDAGAFGRPGTVATGQLPELWGSKVHVSAKMGNDQAATGLYTGSGALSAILGFNPRQFKVGSKRLITLEFDKNPYTQQLGFIATVRRDFQNMAPSTVYPVTYGYNIA